jgi:hypothetical protein
MLSTKTLSGDLSLRLSRFSIRLSKNLEKLRPDQSLHFHNSKSAMNVKRKNLKFELLMNATVI